MPSERTRTHAQRAGDASESLVAERLTAEGWRILARNLRLGRKEVDLLAVDPGPVARLVIVEVRWRRSHDFGWPEETFDWRKRNHLRAAVGRLAELDRLPDGRPVPRLPIAIDLCIVEPGRNVGEGPIVRHHRDALAF